MSVAFLLTSLVIVAMPGTGALITLSAGLSRGARASVVAAFGCTLGIVPHLIAAVTGTAALPRPGDRLRDPRQRAQPEADRLLLRLPAAIRAAARTP
jgi:hypothetical protein